MAEPEVQDLRDRIHRLENRIDEMDRRIAFQGGEQIRLDAGFQAFKSAFEKEMGEVKKDIQDVASAISGRNILFVLGGIIAIVTQIVTLIAVLRH